MPICSDCPATCFGNELDSACINHNGQNLRDYIESKFAELSNVSVANNSANTTDDILSKSTMLSAASTCASAIVMRTFNWSLINSVSSSTLSWNLLPFISSLPSGYAAVVTRVRVTGAGANSVIADASTPSSALNIKLNQFPITVDFLVRIKTSCGDIDAEYKLSIASPTNSGSFTATLNITDLNPVSGDMVLTAQLNNIERKISTLSNVVASMTEANKIAERSLSIVDMNSLLSSLQSDIDDIKSKM